MGHAAGRSQKLDTNTRDTNQARPHRPPLRPGDGEEVDATSEFASVVRYKLGRHRVVMGAEIDAQMPAAEEGAPSQQQQQQPQQQQEQQQRPQ